MNNEYKVVVQASDGGTMQAIAWFKVTVMVTNEEEDGKVSWTVDHNDMDGADDAEVDAVPGWRQTGGQRDR